MSGYLLYVDDLVLMCVDSSGDGLMVYIWVPLLNGHVALIRVQREKKTQET